MINIIIGNRTEKFMKILGIESFPFTKSELRSKYRKLAKIHHPDKLNSDGSFMKRINLAYSHIKNLAIGDKDIFSRGQKILKAEQKNEDIFTLFENCKKCKGTGEIVRHFKAYDEPCDRCIYSLYSLRSFKEAFPRGKIKTACRACKGTGKFRQQNGRIVECRSCKGKGWLYITCPKCKGRGFITRKARTINSKCFDCGGTGRIKVNPFNPVIPKGAVLNSFV